MLIAIEGIDGAGKGTQSRLLRERLVEAGLRAELLSFPRYGETFFARSIVEYLNGGFGPLETIDPHLPALLYAGDRLESRALIQQLRGTADVVLFDRYVASNLAHQAARVAPARREAFIAWLAELEYDVYGLPAADLTVYLDVPVAIASALIARKGARAYTEGADLHEANAAYLSECLAVYRALAGASVRSRWLTLDCTGGGDQILPVAEIAEAIWQQVQSVVAGPQSRARA
ncbi:MAG TPA: thymidylate kinase [Chloroflexota bacterium]|nr:thymidylate kinase [Chloroflexota bacterium]